MPWQLAEELLEGAEFASDRAARRYNLPQAAGGSAYITDDDGARWGPYFQFWT